MPPLPADSIHARACKLKCEKILTRPIDALHLLLPQVAVSFDAYKAARRILLRAAWLFTYSKIYFVILP